MLSSARLFSSSPLRANNQNVPDTERLEQLKKFYSPDLLESIKYAENSIDPQHWEQRRPSTVFSPPYLENFSSVHPYWDRPLEPQTDFTSQYQPLTGKDIPKGATVEDSNSGMAANANLAKLTGLSAEYLSKLKSKTLLFKIVKNKTKKGSIPSFYALVVTGDRNGMIGLGEGKDKTGAAEAIRKATWNAKKNLKHIPRLEDRTILGNIDYRFHGVKLFLRSAPPGFGLRVNHFIFEICELAGIRDLSAKVYKSRNGMNIAKGVVEALTQGQSLDEVALARGKKIIDLRRAYYSPS